MKVRSEAPQLFLFLAGSALLAGLAISNLPPPRELWRAPSTPFDRSAAIGAAWSFRLFQAASSVLPPHASVAPISQPRDPVAETYLHREAVGLLPGRRVLPAAIWMVPTHLEEKAEYLIVAGPTPSPPPGALVLDTPWGSVWRRLRP